jgi:hypothetical protein
MARIHEDLPPRPLPMIDPATEAQPAPVVEYRPGTGGQPLPARDAPLAERILMEVLGGILGRN